jgi:shikimate dehydrogenase
MHNAAFAALHLDYAYMPFAVPPDALATGVRAMRALGLRGVNITIPHKENVVRYLDRLDAMAEKIGSINTIINNNGVLTGYNTDGTGFLEDMKAAGISPVGKSFLLLGAGGAARAIAFALSAAGAETIRITARNPRRGRALTKRIPGADFVPFARLPLFSREADIIVNATPLGMHPGDRSPLSAADINRNTFIFDTVYNRRTELAAVAKKAGAGYRSGIGMLLCQGARAFTLMTGRTAPRDVMRKALLKQIRTD